MRTKYAFFIAVIFIGSATYAEAQTKPTPIYYFNPHWSSDGKKIVFESTKDGKSAIYTIGVDSTDMRRLTDGKATDGQPRWSRDGRRSFFIPRETVICSCI